MEFWNQLVYSAMKGTGSQLPAVTNLPEGLAEVGNLVLEREDIDNEEKLLQLAAFVLNYKQCGTTPVHKEHGDINVCAPEEKKYASEASIKLLNNILDIESIPLLQLWLKLCIANAQIVTPPMLPALFNIAQQKKGLWNLVLTCAGNRGRWLANYNPEWNKTKLLSGDESWETGTVEQRKVFLKQLRQDDPLLALQKLQATWSVEDATTKLLFLECISVGISELDIAFLESLATEKSKKVKEAAKELLKQIPTSSIVLSFIALLSKTVSLKKEKGLLGIGNKTSIQFQLPATIDQSIWDAGIEKLCNTKEFTDEEFIIFQIIQFVPPIFWTQHLSETAADIIGYLQKSETGKKMMPALASATSQFKDAYWAMVLKQESSIFFINLIPLLSQTDQETCMQKYFEKYPDQILAYAIDQNKEWSIALTQKIFRHTVSNPYQYNRAFYNEHIELIPDAIAPQLDGFVPKETFLQPNWNTLKEQILQLIQLKSQTKQSFH